MRIEPLSRTHDRAGFDCGEESLNSFLSMAARQDADRDLGVTFVLVSGEDEARILGYYTLAVGHVLPQIVPEPNKLPPTRSVPVMLLGRLAVDKSRQGLGLGERLLFDALYRAQRVASETGVHAVVVDALHDAAARFYARYGFRAFTDSPLHLYLPLKAIRAMGLKPLEAE